MVLKCILLILQISQFKLTTPYDVSTLSLEGYNINSHDTDPREVASDDGSKMFFIGYNNVFIQCANKIWDIHQNKLP